jgi:hypothetical protein
MSVAWNVHKWWLRRAGAVLIGTVLAEVIIVLTTAQPIRWVGWIAGSLPVSLYVFVVLPLIRRDSLKG